MIFHPVPLYISQPLQQSRLTMIFLRLICVIWIHFTFIVFYFSLLLWCFGFSSHSSSTFGEENEKTKWLFDVPVQAGNVLFCFFLFSHGGDNRPQQSSALAWRRRGRGAKGSDGRAPPERDAEPRERNRLSSPDIHSFYLLLHFTCSHVFHSVGEENGDWRISC